MADLHRLPAIEHAQGPERHALAPARGGLARLTDELVAGTQTELLEELPPHVHIAAGGEVPLVLSTEESGTLGGYLQDAADGLIIHDGVLDVGFEPTYLWLWASLVLAGA
jgi:hypothetical protein